MGVTDGGRAESPGKKMSKIIIEKVGKIEGRR